jgi:hypothetical protein
MSVGLLFPTGVEGVFSEVRHPLATSKQQQR